MNSIWADIGIWMLFLNLICNFITKRCKEIESQLNPDKRDDIALSLMQVKQDGISISWIPNFSTVSDNFFGKKLFSFKSFLKSTIISLFFFIAASYVAQPYVYEGFKALDSSTRYDQMTLFVVTMLLIVAFAVINLVCDYISLVQTRLILRSNLSVIWKLILDAILTAAIIFLWIVFIVHAGSDDGIPFFQRAEHFLGSIGSAVFGELPKEDFYISFFFFVPFITTFSTSIWMWLHGLSELVITLLSGIRPITKWLNVEEKPIRSIGTVINFLIWCIGLILLPVFLFTKPLAS